MSKMDISEDPTPESTSSSAKDASQTQKIDPLAPPINKTPGEPSLYYFDYLGTLHKLSRGAHGYAQYFITSTLDAYWTKNISRKQGLALVHRCIEQLRSRLVINCPTYKVKMITADGILDIDLDDCAKCFKELYP